jgi:hypothetical protein
MKTVEVFKTNVQEVDRARQLTARLLAYFPQHKINFDLQDCDKVLRVEGVAISREKIIELITSEGFQCHVLD